MAVDAQTMNRLKDNCHKAHEQHVESVLEVLCAAFKDVMGVYPNDHLREKLYDAIRFEI